MDIVTDIFASPECADVFAALCEFQAACEAPKRSKEVEVQGETATGKPFKYKFKYAPLEEIHRVITQPMAANGLAHRQFLVSTQGGWIMRTIISHKSGQWMGCDYPVISEKKGAQGFASGTTFARRYGLTLALGVAVEDDDDANLAEGNIATFADTKNAQNAGMVRAPDVRSNTPLRDQLLGNGVASPAERLRAEIGTATTLKGLDAMMKANSDELERIKKTDPGAYENLVTLANAKAQEFYSHA